MVSGSRIAASKSTSNGAGPSRIGSLEGWEAVSAAEATPVLCPRAQLDPDTSEALAVSVVALREASRADVAAVGSVAVSAAAEVASGVAATLALAVAIAMVTARLAMLLVALVASTAVMVTAASAVGSTPDVAAVTTQTGRVAATGTVLAMAVAME